MSHHQSDAGISTQGASTRRKEVEKDWAKVMGEESDDEDDHGKDNGSRSKGDGSPTNSKNSSLAEGSKRSPPGSAGTPNKRKPYRRTKRPKNYNDKSTITTCTPVAADEQPNVYDAVLGEAEDLLRAAHDAQALGRLKMASNYLLLLHARLVGLGKKFDRAKKAEPRSIDNSFRNNINDDEFSLKPTKLNMSPDRSTHSKQDDAETDEIPKTPPKQSPQEPPSNAINEGALHQLTNFLPSNIELDQAMVEHLARAAAELHQKRTGKKTTDDGLLNSPAMNTEKVLQYNKDPSDAQFHPFHQNHYQSSPTSAHPKRKGRMASGSNTTGGPAGSTGCSDIAARCGPAVTWSQDERERFHAAARCTSDPARISQLMGTRTEAQVRAYLSDVAVLEEAAMMEKDLLDDGTPRKKGGRGRKPPTTAMNTVPNANLDAQSMLRGCSFGIL